jgi:hypothetical protein
VSLLVLLIILLRLFGGGGFYIGRPGYVGPGAGYGSVLWVLVVVVVVFILLNTLGGVPPR